MHNYIWCPYHLPSFMKFCSVVSEELRWQTVWRTGQKQYVSIIILYWINNLNFVWMLNQNQYLRIKWQASVMSSLMTNMLFLQTRLQITWYLIVNKTHAFGCHNQRTLAFSRSLVILLPKLLEKGILPVFLLV